MKNKLSSKNTSIRSVSSIPFIGKVFGRLFGANLSNDRIKVEQRGSQSIQLSNKTERTPMTMVAQEISGVYTIDNGQYNIYSYGPKIHEVVDACIELLLASNKPDPWIFSRDGSLVMVKSDKKGRRSIENLTFEILLDKLSRLATFWGKNNNQPLQSPPKDVVNQILKGDHHVKFPALEGIILTPTITRDGKVLNKSGYDPDMHKYVHLSGELEGFIIPESPTDQQIRDAVIVIEDILFNFPFSDQSSKANMFGLFLTAVIREGFGFNSPMAAIDSPQKGTGKTLLAQIAAIIDSGEETGLVNAPTQDEEFQKVITSLLLENGSQVVILDNLDHLLSSSALARALTTGIWKGRMLGSNRIPNLPQSALWMCTGNNIRFGKDIDRRAYLIRIDSKESAPWLRGGFRHNNIKKYVKDQRAALITALLTMVQGWHAAGCPFTESKPVIGSFEDWSRSIGGVLEFCGIEGFLGNLDQLYKDVNMESEEWERFLKFAIDRPNGNEPFLLRSLAELIIDDVTFKDLLPLDVKQRLKGPMSVETLVTALTYAFREKKDVRFGENRIRISRDKTDRTNTNLWKIQEDLGINQ